VDSLGSPVIYVARLPVIPGTSCFYGNWVENVRAGQFIVLGDFVGRCLIRRCTCLIIIIFLYYYRLL